jgi:hypothetical protein
MACERQSLMNFLLPTIHEFTLHKPKLKVKDVQHPRANLVTPAAFLWPFIVY